MFQSWMIEGQDAAKKVWWHGDNILYRNTGDVYSMQKWAALVGAEYAISECFVDPMRFPKRLFEKGELPGMCKGISTHASIEWVHSTFHEE